MNRDQKEGCFWIFMIGGFIFAHIVAIIDTIVNKDKEPKLLLLAFLADFIIAIYYFKLKGGE